MEPAMAAVTHSEPTSAAVAAEPERRSAPASGRALAATVLRMQRTAGNAAVAQAVGRSPARSIQRCGANCSCSSCSSGHAEDEMLEEQFGLLRTAVARRSA
jgi:hypothetical protein